MAIVRCSHCGWEGSDEERVSASHAWIKAHGVDADHFLSNRFNCVDCGEGGPWVLVSGDMTPEEQAQWADAFEEYDSNRLRGDKSAGLAAIFGENPDEDPLIIEFREVAERTWLAEKRSDPADWTDEMRAAHDEDWRLFSEMRGYTAEEISDYARFMELSEAVDAKYGDGYAGEIDERVRSSLPRDDQDGGGGVGRIFYGSEGREIESEVYDEVDDHGRVTRQIYSDASELVDEPHRPANDPLFDRGVVSQDGHEFDAHAWPEELRPTLDASNDKQFDGGAGGGSGGGDAESDVLAPEADFADTEALYRPYSCVACDSVFSESALVDWGAGMPGLGWTCPECGTLNDPQDIDALGSPDLGGDVEADEFNDMADFIVDEVPEELREEEVQCAECNLRQLFGVFADSGGCVRCGSDDYAVVV